MRRGGARKGAGRKKGIGISFDIKRHCDNMIKEMLKDDAIRLKATKQLALQLEDEQEDYLYILENSGLYKIGYSSNWVRREKSYKTHLPNYNLIYLLKSRNAFRLENDLHLMFEDERGNGEWFELTKENIIKAVSYCSKNQ